MTTTMVSALWMTIVCGARLVREGVAVRSSSAMSIIIPPLRLERKFIVIEDAKKKTRNGGDGGELEDGRRRNGRNPLMFKSSGNEDGREKPTYHTIFSTECNTYYWQSLGLYYSFKKVKQEGKFTRLMACDKTPPPGLDIVPNTHVHPNYAKHPVTGDRYSAYNKPYSIMHWMERSRRRIL